MRLYLTGTLYDFVDLNSIMLANPDNDIKNGTCHNVSREQLQESTSVINITFRDDVTGSFCIGFIVNASIGNEMALAYFKNSSENIGNIMINENTSIAHINEINITFVTSGRYRHFQFCADGSEMTYSFSNCLDMNYEVITTFFSAIIAGNVMLTEHVTAL